VSASGKSSGRMTAKQRAASPRKALAEAAKDAARDLATASTSRKNKALAQMAKALRDATEDIVAANEKDVEAAKRAGQSAAFLDRLRLDADRVEGMAKAVEAVALLEDPVGEVTDTWRRPNGLEVRKVRLPLGVVLMIYESRPNVTSDAAALCVKSGNAVILRGGSEAFRSNQAIRTALAEGLRTAGLPPACVQLVPDTDRASMLELLTLDAYIDLCIPRGGEQLIRFVAENARVPVVKHYKGVCHVYLHKDARAAMAESIVLNAKTSRPGVCNALECLLVDSRSAKRLLPAVGRVLVQAGVELRGCAESVKILRSARVKVTPASEDDYGREFLDLVLALKVVKGVDGALSHIAKYGSEHTEAIITESRSAARRFTREVCASAVLVNASTRFNDGGELGLGAEVGISTSRLHAFGPMGLRELTSQKYVVEGDGQVR